MLTYLRYAALLRASRLATKQKSVRRCETGILGSLSQSAPGKRIGLFGGSFDPPHVGHVALLKAAFEKLQLDGVRVVPVGLPVHRQLSDCSTAAQRLAWMQRIFADDCRVQVLDWEVMEPEPTPSIATLRRFAREYPVCRAVLLLGADAFAGMDGWVEYPDHASLCDVAVFNRAGCAALPCPVAKAFETMPVEQWLQQPQAYGRRVDVEVSLPDVSATGIRRMAVNKESLAGMVSECVRSEIEQAYAIGTA